MMANAVEQVGVPPSQITLEVTETRLLEYGAQALDIFARLRIKGFGLSIDDFGTGASNIDRLQMYPFTELKIDQSFTRGALTDSFARASVEMSVRLAKEMGLKIVAEGVETTEMWDFLAGLGVDEAQGYLMARPLPPAEFAKLLATGLPHLRKALSA
jgi:EAL domain-containing protein (putative c-di-GMP-specific phosphodiesterase class I)